MKPFRSTDIIEQVTAHLREQLPETGHGVKLPGLVRLATQLGVSKATLRKSMRILEAEGLVAVSEDGYSRTVTVQHAATKRPLRIGYLLFDAFLDENTQTQQTIVSIQQQLEREGFAFFVSTVNQAALRHDVGRLARYIRKTKADAWIVSSGSLGLLGWFAEQKIPCMAFAGRRRSHSIAAVGPDTAGAIVKATRMLIGLGHRRIVYLCREPLRKPQPGYVVTMFLEELAAHGIPTSEYNQPDWEESSTGLNVLLRSLFKVTPPTALIVDDVVLAPAVLQFLAHRKIAIPEQISLAVTDVDPAFPWCTPQIAHIHWENTPIVKRIVNWATAISMGREDVKQIVFPAEFLPGGTIGPAPKF